MQIKVTMRYYPTSTKIAIIKTTVTSVREDIEKHSCTAGENLKWCNNFGKQLGNFLNH